MFLLINSLQGSGNILRLYTWYIGNLYNNKINCRFISRYMIVFNTHQQMCISSELTLDLKNRPSLCTAFVKWDSGSFTFSVEWRARLSSNTRRRNNVDLLLGQRLWRWPNIKPTLVLRRVFAGMCVLKPDSWLSWLCSSTLIHCVICLWSDLIWCNLIVTSPMGVVC